MTGFDQSLALLLVAHIFLIGVCVILGCTFGNEIRVRREALRSL